jgi:uncharacterized alkaline shock family protein YloU
MSERDRRPRSPLESERGSTTVKDGVVSKIAGMAAGEVEGIHMGGSASRAARGLLGSVTGPRNQTQGISVAVGKVETAIDLTMEIEYGRNILQLTERVRNKITERVEDLTGLRVTELNVTINDVIYPDREGGGGGEVRRDVPRSEPEDEEEVRREGEPPEEDQTVELRLDDEEARRVSRRDRRRER